MKKLIFMLAVVMLAGCASVPGLREGKPDVTLHTAKSPADYGACVAAGWGDFFGVTVNHSATSDGGYTVSMPDAYTGNNGVADISHSGDVQVHYRLRFGSEKFTKVVNGCK